MRSVDKSTTVTQQSGVPEELQKAQALIQSNHNFGEIVQAFSDFRTINGLTLPFKISGTFNWLPEPTQSWVMESIKINETIDPGLFERPKSPIRQ